MRRVRVSELKSQLSKHLRAVEGGESIEVLDRARPIARVVPATASELEIVPAARKFTEVRSRRIAPLDLKTSSLQALKAERGLR